LTFQTQKHNMPNMNKMNVKKGTNSILKRIRITILIVCTIPVLILSGLTFVDGKLLGAIGVENKAEAANNYPSSGQVYTISTSNGLAITQVDYEKGNLRTKATKLDLRNTNQHFTWISGNDPKKGDFFFNGTNLSLGSNGTYEFDPGRKEVITLSDGNLYI
jgi:hypothetical protein